MSSFGSPIMLSPDAALEVEADLQAAMAQHALDDAYRAQEVAEARSPTLKALREAYRFISQPASMTGSGPVTTITYRTGRFNELTALLRKAISEAETRA